MTTNQSPPARPDGDALDFDPVDFAKRIEETSRLFVIRAADSYGSAIHGVRIDCFYDFEVQRLLKFLRATSPARDAGEGACAMRVIDNGWACEPCQAAWFTQPPQKCHRDKAAAPDAVREAAIRRNYAQSAMLVCISLADEVVCQKGRAADVAKALRERALSAPVLPADGAMDAHTSIKEIRTAFYSILTKYYPKDATMDAVWQELKEAGILNSIILNREPTPDMRIAGGIAWYHAIDTAETAVDCADACWKAMWDKA